MQTTWRQLSVVVRSILALGGALCSYQSTAAVCKLRDVTNNAPSARHLTRCLPAAAGCTCNPTSSHTLHCSCSSSRLSLVTASCGVSCCPCTHTPARHRFLLLLQLFFEPFVPRGRLMRRVTQLAACWPCTHTCPPLLVATVAVVLRAVCVLP